MADVFNKEKRSDIMKRVRSKGNKSTELKMIEIFKSLGITGWRRNYSVKGHPDFVFPGKRIAVFEHDKEVTAQFEKRGWTVIRVWECELKKCNRDALQDKLSILGSPGLRATTIHCK